MDSVREVLTLTLHGGVEVNQRNVLLLSHLLDVRNNAVVYYAVIDAPSVTVCWYRKAEPYLGFGRQSAEGLYQSLEVLLEVVLSAPVVA